MPIGRDGDGERTGFSDFSVRAETPGEHLTCSPRSHPGQQDFAMIETVNQGHTSITVA
ncbi:hypothetical protein HF263_36610 [Rhizobium leguminosarum]|uniref:hypothetical protein n=1 Tax=Rhizobium leguminosarum TaxID=384 RepID=UPI0003A95AE6|nr:hypothetical protein [Rhizobium leguminosarum]MBY2995124.1 hypothetical protein [Rhizobium leguminosarum]MBY3034462.1 hypothetical protein [Rhizobium leguminosarum]MBY3061490.1 hypothetical protein [Rhizobium leguminosarum]